MDTLQRHINTENSIYEKLQRHYQKQSDKLLHKYIFDKPYNLDMKEFLIVRTMDAVICQDLDCDYKVTNCMLEKMNIYLEKNKK